MFAFFLIEIQQEFSIFWDGKRDDWAWKIGVKFDLFVEPSHPLQGRNVI